MSTGIGRERRWRLFSTDPDWKIYGTGWAAELLGLKPTTLLSRIKKMGIVKTH